jgi:hypothetical protein
MGNSEQDTRYTIIAGLLLAIILILVLTPKEWHIYIFQAQDEGSVQICPEP